MAEFDRLFAAGPDRTGWRPSTRYGEWTGLIYGLAEFDPGRADRLWRMPLRDLLCSALEHGHTRDLEAYRHSQLLWIIRAAAGDKAEPPELPDSLKD